MDFDRSKLKFEGIGVRGDVLRLRKPDSLEGAWSNELVSLPEGLHLPYKKPVVPSGESHDLLAKGRPMQRRGSLEAWLPGYEDLYDELSSKRRARLNRILERERRVEVLASEKELDFTC
jgi:hypothetical protein